MPTIFLHIPANNITVRQELRANAYAEVRVSHCWVSDVQSTLQRCVLSPFSFYFKMTISPNKVKKDAGEEHRWAVEKNR